VAEDLHQRAVVAQNAAGLLVKAPITGAPQQSPYLAIINRQGVIMLRAAGELGFSPVSRPRTSAGGSLQSTASESKNDDHGRKPKLSFEAFLETHPDRQMKH
jgi:hypothetical protein